MVAAVETAADLVGQVVLEDVELVVLDWDYTAVVVLVVFAVVVVAEIALLDFVKPVDYQFDEVVEHQQVRVVVVVVVVVAVAAIVAEVVCLGYSAEVAHWTLAEVDHQHCCLEAQPVDIGSEEGTVVADVVVEQNRVGCIPFEEVDLFAD